jgi:hypothetical protein
MSFYFLTEFFKYFFRVLHEASSSLLKYLHNFQNHPVCTSIRVLVLVVSVNDFVSQ